MEGTEFILGKRRRSEKNIALRGGNKAASIVRVLQCGMRGQNYWSRKKLGRTKDEVIFENAGKLLCGSGFKSREPCTALFLDHIAQKRACLRQR